MQWLALAADFFVNVLSDAVAFVAGVFCSKKGADAASVYVSDHSVVVQVSVVDPVCVVA